MSITNNATACDSVAKFTFKSWQDQYQLIHHLILYSNVLMVLQGQNGCGRSSYIKTLSSNLPEDFLCRAIDSDKLTKVEDLALYLRQLFSLSTINSDQTSTNFDLVKQINHRKKHCLLIIDDAHKLPDEILSELLKCLNNQEQDIYFHCLLVGDPMLTCKFDQAPFSSCKDSFTHFIDMPELDVDQARSFLIYKFSSLGTMQVSSLTVEQLEILIEKSEGSLVKLTKLAQQQLIGGGDNNNESQTVSKFDFLKIKPSKRGMLSMLGAFLIVTFILQGLPKTSVHQTQKLTLPSRQVMRKKEQFIKEFQDRPLLAATVNLTKKVKVIAKVNSNYVPMSMIPKHSLLAKRVNKPNKRSQQKILKALTTKKIHAVVSSSGPTLERQLSAIKQARRASLSKAPVIVDSVLAIPMPTKTHEISTKTITVTKKKVTRSKGHLGLGYGMQFVASHQKSSLKQFARKYKIYNKAKYYETYAKGKKWYVLVLGDYRSKAEAKRALSHLSTTLKNKKPWLRSIKGLKRTL